MLEIGVNRGHSAYLALSTNPQLEYHGVDICYNAYVEVAVSWLEGEFPGRVFFHRGDSLSVVPALAARGTRSDLFHVDGTKFNYFDDVVNCSRAVEGSEALVVVDDAEMKKARVALKSLSLFGVIRPPPEFPAMPESDPSRNEIKTILPPGVRRRPH
jgi:predicted O-methyltransferase YrrM